MSNTAEMTPTNSALARNPKSQDGNDYTRSNIKISQSSIDGGKSKGPKVVTDELGQNIGTSPTRMSQQKFDMKTTT